MEGSGGHDPAAQAEAADLHRLGVAALADGHNNRAAELISRAIELDAEVPSFYDDLAATLTDTDSLAPATVSRLRRAWPRDALVQQLAANALFQWGDLRGARDACRAALAIHPGDSSVLQTLAFALGELGENEEAVVAYRSALAADAGNATLYHNLGDCLRQLGKLDEAQAALEQAVCLAPENAKSQLNLAHVQQMLCDWRGIEERWAAVRAALACGTALNPFFLLSVPTTAREQLLSARAWAAERFGQPGPGDQMISSARPPGPRERLHVGYLSSDLRDHAVARLIAEVFELHDRSAFAISAYSIGPDDRSPLRRRLIEGVDHFVDLYHASRAEAAKRFEDDAVDILVDLNGHTARNRADILAMRPAPIQVSYWGYPGTTGAPFIDYAIADRFVVPEWQRDSFSERLAYMPHCYMPNDRKRPIAAGILTRTEHGLPESGFVFCAFNHVMKLTPEVFATWMRVLTATPGSVLWLLETNRWPGPNLRSEAERAGVDPRRLIFGPALPLPEHLARHRLADLFLDTLPYNGHTTTSDALWTGLPVLTCSGEAFASRVAGSALYAAGLPELVTSSLADYEAQAVGLARDPTHLHELRERLMDNRETAPLFDCRCYTRDLEALYARMWDDYCRASGARGIDRTPLSA